MKALDYMIVLGLCAFGLFLSAARDIVNRFRHRRFERFMESDWRERWR